MTYSCCDFTDNVFAELHRVGAIHEAEYDNDDLNDNASLQADYAMAGIARLVDVKEALERYRCAVADFAASKGISLQDGVFCEADDHARKALAAIEHRESDDTDGNAKGEALPGPTRQEIAEIMMQDIVGDYDTPDTIPEWAWVEKVASFAHMGNGKEAGVWEFVLNLGNHWDDIPEKLVPVIQKARESGMAYLIFHQGT